MAVFARTSVAIFSAASTLSLSRNGLLPCPLIDSQRSRTKLLVNSNRAPRAPLEKLLIIHDGFRQRSRRHFTVPIDLQMMGEGRKRAEGSGKATSDSLVGPGGIVSY